MRLGSSGAKPCREICVNQTTSYDYSGPYNYWCMDPANGYDYCLTPSGSQYCDCVEALPFPPAPPDPPAPPPSPPFVGSCCGVGCAPGTEDHAAGCSEPDGLPTWWPWGTRLQCPEGTVEGAGCDESVVARVGLHLVQLLQHVERI